MKRYGILNSSIARVLAGMGHTDQIAVGDCGLPIPEGPERIDLALALGEPPFLRVLEAEAQNPAVLAQVEQLFAGRGAAVEFVPHSALKEMTRRCKAVIRTGEATPYANIILQSGCIFG